MGLSGKHVLAVASISVGLAIVVRGLWLAMPSSLPTPVSSPSALRGTPASAEPGMLDLGLLEVQSSPTETEKLASLLNDRISDASRGVMSEDDSREMARVAAGYLHTVFSGSSADYVAFVRDQGGSVGIDLSDETSANALRTFVHSASAGYIGSRLSLSQLAIRPRVLNASNVFQDDFGAKISMTYAEERFPALASLAYDSPHGQVITGDTFEVLLPIEYKGEDGSIPIRLGIWMTRVPARHTWLPSRVVTYAPRDARTSIVHPVY